MVPWSAASRTATKKSNSRRPCWRQCVAILFDRTNPEFRREPFEAAARTRGLELQFVDASGAEDMEPALDTTTCEHAEGLVVAFGPVNSAHETRIAQLAIQSQLPSMWAQSGAVGRGGLMGYASRRADLHRRAATYVAKILEGARPAD